MATLKVDTAASGPANHRIEVKYLDAERAGRELQAIIQVIPTLADGASPGCCWNAKRSGEPGPVRVTHRGSHLPDATRITSAKSLKSLPLA